LNSDRSRHPPRLFVARRHECGRARATWIVDRGPLFAPQFCPLALRVRRTATPDTGSPRFLTVLKAVPTTERKWGRAVARCCSLSHSQSTIASRDSRPALTAPQPTGTGHRHRDRDRGPANPNAPEAPRGRENLAAHGEGPYRAQARLSGPSRVLDVCTRLVLTAVGRRHRRSPLACRA
jgi:hypothetical protein